MPSELAVHAVQRGPMESTISDGASAFTVDYPLPDDEDLRGMTPLGLSFASLAGCCGGTVAFALRRDGKAVEETGRRHPSRTTPGLAPDSGHQHMSLYGDRVFPWFLDHTEPREMPATTPPDGRRRPRPRA